MHPAVIDRWVCVLSPLFRQKQTHYFWYAEINTTLCLCTRATQKRGKVRNLGVGKLHIFLEFICITKVLGNRNSGWGWDCLLPPTPYPRSCPKLKRSRQCTKCVFRINSHRQRSRDTDVTTCRILLQSMTRRLAFTEIGDVWSPAGATPVRRLVVFTSV